MMTIPYDIVDAYKAPDMLVEVPMVEFISIMSFTPKAERPEWLPEALKSGADHVVLPVARVTKMRQRVGLKPYPRDL
jgi:hypothetical protein